MNTLAAKQPEMVDCNHLTVHTVHTATNSATTTSNTSSNKMKPFRKMINSSKLFSTEDDIVINWDDLAAVDTTTTTTKRQHEQQQQQQQQEQQHYCTNKDQRDDVEDVYRPNKNSHSAGKSYSSLSTTCLPHNNDHRLHHQDEQRYRQEYQLRIKAETEVTNLSLELKDMEQRLIAVEKQNIQERQYMLEQLEETKQAEKDVVRNLSSTTERMSATELKLKLTEQKLIRALQDANNDKIVYANRIKEMSERLSELQSAKEQLTQALRDSECTARDINDSAEQQVNALSKELYSTKMKLQSVQEKLAIAVEKRDGEAMEKNALQEQVADMSKHLSDTEIKLKTVEEKLALAVETADKKAREMTVHQEQQVKELETQLQSTQKKLSKAQKGLAKMRVENENSTTCIRMLRQMVEEREQALAIAAGTAAGGTTAAAQESKENNNNNDRIHDQKIAHWEQNQQSQLSENDVEQNALTQGQRGSQEESVPMSLSETSNEASSSNTTTSKHSFTGSKCALGEDGEPEMFLSTKHAEKISFGLKSSVNSISTTNSAETCAYRSAVEETTSEPSMEREDQTAKLTQSIANEGNPTIPAMKKAAPNLAEFEENREESDTGTGNSKHLSTAKINQKREYSRKIVPLHIRDMYQKIGFYNDRKLQSCPPILCLAPESMLDGPAKDTVLQNPDDLIGVYKYGYNSSNTVAYEAIKWFRVIPYEHGVTMDLLDQARREDFTTPAGKVDDTFYEELSRGLAEIQVDARKKACDRVPYLFESTGVQVKACSLHTSIPIGEGLNLCTVDGNLPTEFAHDITAVANCDRKPNSVYAISVQSDDLEKGLGRNAVPKDVFESCAFSDNAHPADEFAILLSDETQTTKLNNKTYSADNLTTAEYTYVDTVNTDGQAKEFDKGTLVESDNIATSSFSQMLAESPMGQVVNSFASCLLPDCHSVIDKSLDFQEVCVIEDRTHHQSTSVESVVVMAAVNEENQTTPVDHGQKGATHSYDTRNRDSKAGFRQKLEDALAVSQVADSFKMCLVPDCHLIVADIEPDIPVFCQKDIYKVSPGEAQKIREATTKNATVPLDTDQEQASFSNNYLKSDFPGDKGLKIKKAAKEAEDPNIPAHVVILADCISEIGIQGVASMREEPGKRESDTNN